MSMIQYNKLYQSLKKISAEWHGGHAVWKYYWSYFIFTENGNCYNFHSIDENPQNTLENFKTKKSDMVEGKYSFKDGVLEMKFDSSAKIIAEVQDEKIILHSINDANPFGNWDLFILLK